MPARCMPFPWWSEPVVLSMMITDWDDMVRLFAFWIVALFTLFLSPSWNGGTRAAETRLPVGRQESVCLGDPQQ